MAEGSEFAVSDGETEFILDPTMYGEGVRIKLVGSDSNVDNLTEDKKTVRVLATFAGNDFESQEKIPMVIKVIGDINWQFEDEEDSKLSPAKKFHKIWKYLQEIGCNVPPNVVVLDENRAAMTDMTANGGEFFGKVKRNKISVEAGMKKKRELSKKEVSFLSLDIDDVKQRVLGLIESLSEKSIEIQSDDPYDLLIKDDGTYEIVLLDFQTISKYMYWREGDKFLTQKEIGDKEILRGRVCDELDKFRSDLLKIKA
ncbi:hypothetical protein A2572_01850 [Candidatus Collierbacteria bacterium RIFOXYD1_FULL_40_9]|uniref:Uncharacterized protein n=1 Tax=Candidatus Collierbacteria bacterium RIFOXYD1_FULL_40_9 TaxID=1817731 RepID=A0A1F5FUY9_9BACT|nr:MAG: hypothetical protein A2572_01850 [Candidatus Collierbacteria bacterium RIFOXYD1_FULL_40_9]